MIVRTTCCTLIGWVFANSVAAATLSMRWQGEAGNRIERAPGETAVIEFHVDLIAGDTLSGMGIRQHIVPATQIATQSLIPGWGDGSASGQLGFNPQWVAWFATTPADDLSGPGSFVIGTQTIRLDDYGDGSDLAIRFGHQFTTFIDSSFHILDGTDWNANYNTVYPGYIAYGDWGNPGWGTDPLAGHQPTPNPLLLGRVPEPTTAALALVAGAIATMRRRRRPRRPS